MTPERIAYLLDLLVVELADRVPPPEALATTRAQGATDTEDAMLAHYEWAFVKGAAASAILQLARAVREGRHR